MVLSYATCYRLWKMPSMLLLPLQQIFCKKINLLCYRKAYRLGKFLANANKIRKSPLTRRGSALEAIANAGEGLYYFVEQFTWYVNSVAAT